MASYKPRRSLVPRQHGHGVSLGQVAIDSFCDDIHSERQDAGFSERDTISDQADGARGLEQALRAESESCSICQKARETGGLPARRSIETRR